MSAAKAVAQPLYPLDDLPEQETGWSMLHRLREMERWDGASLQALQRLHLQHLLVHHAQHTPQFQQRLAVAGLAPSDLTTVQALRRLPPLERADVQRAGPGLFSTLVPFDHLPVHTASTSGSTGQPVVVRRTQLNTWLNEAATLRDHAWWQRPRNGGRITMIRPQFDQVRQVSAHEGSQDNVAQQIPITTDVHEQIRLIAAFEPQVLLVYPNNLAALLEVWQNGGGVPPSLLHLKTIGETVSPALRALAWAVLQRPIEDSYSSEEMGMMALQCPVSGMYHTLAETHHIEVVHEDGSACAPGETGRLLVTDLHNLATPLVRYAIGDWAEVGGPCACGRHLPTLQRILGRERNLVRLPDGRRHWPLIGFQRFEQVMPVRQYQVIQHSLQEVELRVRLDSAITPLQREALSQIVREALGHDFVVRVQTFDAPLPAGANGKFEEFVCKVQQ